MDDHTTANTGDVSLLIAAALAQRALAEVSFPIQVQIPSSLVQRERDNPLGDADLEFTRVATEEDTPEISEINEGFAAGISEMVQRVRDGTIDESSADPGQLQAIKTLIAVLGANPGKDSFYKAQPGDIDSALTELVSKKWTSVSVEWVRISAERPSLTLSNPILLTGMTVHVQARVKACIKVLGKHFCATVTTPRIRLEARQCRLDLVGVGARAMVLPQFKDLDFVLKIKIWKWTVKVRIGITGIVNTQLRKQGPLQILDLSLLEQRIPYSNKKMTIDSFEFPADPKGLSVRASMRIG